MKRRTLISLGIGSLAFAVGPRYVPRQARGSSVAIDQDFPRPEEAPLLRFTAIGDVGTGKNGQYNVARAMHQRWQSSAFPLVLMTGDNIYPNGEIERIGDTFEQPYSALLSNNVKFYASLGNHDVRTNQGEDQIRYPGYNMASRYYTFTQAEGAIQFFALDTNQAFPQPSSSLDAWNAQLEWLTTELQKSLSPWKVVFAHHPVYSSGRHGSNSFLIESLAPVLKAHGVQLYLNGHDHHYERSHPIEGITYLTTGHSAKLRRVGRSAWTAQATSQLGFTLYELYEDQLLISAVDAQNRVHDQARILQSISAEAMTIDSTAGPTTGPVDC